MKMKSLMRPAFVLSCALAVRTAAASDATIWTVGEPDGRPDGFALAPDGFRDFLARDFGYEDKFYLVGHSDPSTDFPYVLPGPADTWGGTWPTSGWRTHEVNILFGLDEQPDDDCLLAVDLADYAKRFPPLVKVSVNGQDAWFRLNDPDDPTAAGRRYGQQEPTVDTLSLTGRFERATPRRLEMPLRRGTLRKGGNTVHVTVLEGSWILFDRVALEGPSSVRPTQSEGLFVRDVAAAPYESDHDGKRVQPLLVDVEWLGATPTLSVEIDGRELFNRRVEAGRSRFEVPMPAVRRARTSCYRVLCDGREVASGCIERAPRPEQTLADYVDTRIGTAHSRWMIAPGPWMPFGMVKLSPDNQNAGWQAGYQPSFETIGCFSHIHEWTLGGLGLMATNGELKVRVGDERNPDEGYSSRIDKRTEQAGIGC